MRLNQNKWISTWKLHKIGSSWELPFISYLSILQALVHGPLVILDPEGDEIGGPIHNALDGRQLVHRRHRLLQEVATPGNPASAITWFFKLRFKHPKKSINIFPPNFSGRIQV